MIQEERPDLPRGTHPSAFRIKDCLVLPALNRIERDGEVLQIEPRVMQVLVCLADHPGEVLSRQMLFDRVWADSVVCEEALTRTISELRRVLRDDTKTPRVIETIRKGGYRLIAPVSPVAAPERTVAPARAESPGNAPPVVAPRNPESPIPESSQVDPAGPATRRRSLGAARVGAWALAALALLAVGTWGARRFARPAAFPPASMEVSPLTSYPGLELFPALSPNGSMVAFSWAGEGAADGSPLDLYVQKIPSGSPVRLTSLAGSEGFPSWSPDGAEIAFARDLEGASEICTVPVTGGEIRHWAQLDGSISGLDWSPDGRWIAYSAADSSKATTRIHLLRLEDRSRRALTSPMPGNQGDIAPAFSPDSRSIAFLRVNDRREQDAYRVPITGGEARKLDMDGRRVSGVDWLTPDELIVSASSKIDFGLWTVLVDSGRRSPLAIPGGRIQRVSLAQNGRRLAYEKVSFAQSIWCVDLSPTGARRRPTPLIASTQRESEPTFSPDGNAVAFVSDRSGSPEIWIADAAGGHPRRLTDQKATQLIRPRWSPDGTRIAYSCNVGGHLSIYATDVSSQITRRLLTGGPYTLGVWSRNGNLLYYGVDTPAGVEVWRARPDGSDPRRMTETGRQLLGESPDGRGLYCIRSGGAGLWFLPFDGGPESEIVPAERCRDWQETVVTEGGFYFTVRGRETSTLGFYDVAAGRADSLASLQWYAASLALSPNRSMLLYDSLGKLEVDLMLTEVTD